MAFSLKSSRLASVGLASIVAVGVIGVGTVAFADEPGSPAPTSDQADHPAHPIAVGVKNLLADAGVTRDELKEGAQAGMTLGQIIDTYGDISADQAKTNALDKLSEKLDELVANGRITREQADTIEAGAPALADRILAAVPGAHLGDGEHHGKILTIGRHALKTVADVLGTDVATLREQLASGQTIADIAGDQTQEVIDTLTENANAFIDKAADDGKIPEDKVDTAKERAAAAIEKLVNEGRPHKPAGGERRLPARGQ
ncbi:MAG: hypothetical protein AB7J35_06660 [Dehalococcoidia bacterium]